MQPGIPTSHDVPSRKASTEKPSVSTKAEAIANAKRTRGEYQAASEIKNTLHGADLRKHSKTSVLATTVTKCWESAVSATICNWSFGHILESFWKESESDTTIVFDSNSSELLFTSAGRALSMRAYELEPRNHAEAMSRPSERAFWIAAEEKEMASLKQLNFAEIVDIPDKAHLLLCIWIYK